MICVGLSLFHITPKDQFSLYSFHYLGLLIFKFEHWSRRKVLDRQYSDWIEAISYIFPLENYCIYMFKFFFLFLFNFMCYRFQ